MTNKLDVFDNKLIVLYILENASKPLTINQIVKFCEEFDDITYFDVCVYTTSLKETLYINEIIEKDTILYEISDTGLNALKELLELIPGVNLYNLKKMINKNTSSVNTEYSIDSSTLQITTDEYKVSCNIKDGNDELVNISLYAGNKEQAKNISKNWSKNADKIYTTLLEMLTKD